MSMGFIIHLPLLLKFSCILDHSSIHMFNPVNNFLMPSMNHWPLLRITKITTCPLNNITSCWVMVSTLRTLKAASSCFKFTFEATLKALIN